MGKGSFVIAITPTGREVTANIERSPQVLISGASGSGKTEAVNRLLFGVTTQYADNDRLGVATVILDPKAVGYLPWRRHAYIFDNPRDFLRVGNALANDAERRYQRLKDLGTSVFVPDESTPRVTIVLDECPDIFGSTELTKAQISELQKVYTRLSNKARGCGYTIVYATQNPLVDGGIPSAIRNNCSNRMVFRLSSPEFAKAATADRVEEANPVLIDPRMPGDGFYLTDDTGGYYERGRVLRLSDRERDETLARIPGRPYLFALDFDNEEYRG